MGPAASAVSPDDAEHPASSPAESAAATAKAFLELAFIHGLLDLVRGLSVIPQLTGSNLVSAYYRRITKPLRFPAMFGAFVSGSVREAPPKCAAIPPKPRAY
ncbi:hypothetical protein AHIS1636_04110 [Arthrobacter mangrovi]|uniref:Uncharacterized protein n=1 Tax=Arthrobacter mangrovi TaxID=2966350 RepID=A0ABQ5MQT7_9MICC|nr:hypothetical protein AHIS1636_04110 [Arthrobacter mangrovi]